MSRTAVPLPHLWLPLTSALAAGLSPHTSAHRIVPSIVGGLLVGAAVLGWQRWAGLRARPPLFERPSLLHWAVLGLLLLVFAPTLQFLFSVYTESIWENAHGLILPIGLVLLARRILRASAQGAPEAASPLGFALLGVSVVCAAVDQALGVGFVGAVGLVLALPGLSLLFLGRERTRELWPVFVLAVFLIPVPTPLAHSLGLPESVAWLAQQILQALGTPVAREGVLLIMSDEFFAVSDRCSGIASLVGGYAVAVFVAIYARSTWQRILVLLLPWPLTVLLTALRVAVLVGMAAEGDLLLLESATHGLSGIFVFWGLVLPLAALAARHTLPERIG